MFSREMSPSAPLRRSAIIAIGLALVLFSSGVRADHAHGTGPTTASGTIPLGPVGGGADQATVSLSLIGISVSSGDSLRYSWAVDNGSGPAIRFQVFAHSATLHVVYVNTSGARDAGTWQVPGADPYYASWTNPANRAVNVTYVFNGIPTQDATLIVIVGVLLMLAVLGYVAVTVRGIKREAKGDSNAAAPIVDAARPVAEPHAREDRATPPR